VNAWKERRPRKKESKREERYFERPTKRQQTARARKTEYQGEATNGAVSRDPAQGWRTRGRPRIVRGVVGASYDVIGSVTSPPLPPTINDATLLPRAAPRGPFVPGFASLPLPPLVPTPATHQAEPTGPSTQRGGGCFCNLATPSIFSIALATSRLISPSLFLSLRPIILLELMSLSFSSFLFLRSLFLFSLSVRYVLLSLGDINNAIAQASNSRGDDSNDV